MPYMLEDREPAWYPTALLHDDEGRPLLDWRGRQVPFDPRLSEAVEPGEGEDGAMEFEANICVGPRSHTYDLVTEEQHRFITQFEQARRRQEDAEIACAEARWAPPPPPPPPREPDPEEIPPEGRLTPRQEEFCRHYAAQPVATRAAALAGYAKDNAANQGHRLLKNPFVLDRVAELRAASGVAYVVQRDTMHDKLEAVFFEALSERNHAAAVAALRLQASLAGMTVRAAATRDSPTPKKPARRKRPSDDKSRVRSRKKAEKSR